MKGNIAYLGLGSNLGDREDSLARALWRLQSQDLHIRRVSSLYETLPVGPVLDQPAFCNAVAQVHTTLEPLPLLRRCLQVEAELGRKRTVDKGPRTIDIDLLLMGRHLIDLPELRLPHPELTRRAFALVPLLEISPMTMLPGTGQLLCTHLDPVLRQQSIIKVGPLRLPASAAEPPPRGFTTRRV